jgi:hypothetical protein
MSKDKLEVLRERLDRLSYVVDGKRWPDAPAVDLAELAADAIAVLADATSALRVQWECNHSEYCGGQWPHPEGKRCHWPMPREMQDEPTDEYRTYESVTESVTDPENRGRTSAAE